MTTKANTISERLIRIEDKLSSTDEAVKRIEDKISCFITTDDLIEVKIEMEKKVSQKEFDPVKNAVYGLIGLIVISVVIAWLTGIIKT
jgi:hypothetical protein